jgi:hypothetical protein
MYKKEEEPAMLVEMTIFLTPAGGLSKMAFWSMDGSSECSGYTRTLFESSLYLASSVTSLNNLEMSSQPGTNVFIFFLKKVAKVLEKIGDFD